MTTSIPDLALTFLGHAVLLDLPHFVDDALENAFEAILRQGSAVVRCDVLEDLGLAPWFVDREFRFSLGAAYFFHDGSPFVEEFHQTAVNFVDTRTVSRERLHGIKRHLH